MPDREEMSLGISTDSTNHATGTDKSLIEAHASAARCSSNDDPVAINELFIRTTDNDACVSAISGLRFIEHHVGQWLMQFNTLNPLYMQRGVNCG